MREKQKLEKEMKELNEFELSPGRLELQTNKSIPATDM